MLPGGTHRVPLWYQLRRAKLSPEQILRWGKVLEPPVPILDIARALEIEVVEVPLKDVSGEVESGPEGAVIRLSRKDSPLRKRFTIAHEIGHLFLHELGKRYRDKSFDETALELEANRFGAELLMPMWMLDAYVMGLTTDAKRLARIFQVSDVAMKVRLMKWTGAR